MKFTFEGKLFKIGFIYTSASTTLPNGKVINQEITTARIAEKVWGHDGEARWEDIHSATVKKWHKDRACKAKARKYALRACLEGLDRDFRVAAWVAYLKEVRVK